MKLLKIALTTAALLSLVACVSLPTATGEGALAVSNASNAVTAQSVDEVLTQNINIPLYYMLWFGAACTFVPNPLQLVGKIFGMALGGIQTVFSLFKR